MEREEFTRRLKVATQRLLAITRTYVIDALPEAVMFAPAMQPWQELVPLAPGTVVFAEDRGRFPETPRRRCSLQEMVALLWRDGRVPYWIDLVVVAVEDGRTLIEAEVSPRFTDDPAIVDQPVGEDRPFLIKVRNNPPWVVRRMPIGPVRRFRLGWRDDPAAESIADPDEGRVSLRRLYLRRLLAGSHGPRSFAQIRELLRSPPASDLAWRDPEEQLEAIDEAERALSDWGEVERVESVDAAFFEGESGSCPVVEERGGGADGTARVDAAGSDAVASRARARRARDPGR